MIKKMIQVAVAGLAIALVIFALLVVPVYFLWNWLMPVIFGLPEITFWQALGLMVLFGILVKGTSVQTRVK